MTSIIYSQQLRVLSEKIAEKRPLSGKSIREIMLLHDNARPHVAKLTQQTIADLGWKVLPHPASPDLAPSDFHVFLSLQNHIDGMIFENDQEIEICISDFFTQKPASFY
jgi:histone-lysine N-methyltransferase SETMAR